MKKHKQVLPLLLTSALLFSSVVSFPVYAEGTDKTLIKDTEQRSDWQGKLYPESFIGEYEQAGENDIKQYGSDPSEKDTYTYYFLAPTEWFDTESGALNEEIGFYGWNQDTKDAVWPGEKMTPAPEVGDNVFKVENVPSDISFIIFNTYVDAGDPPDPALA